MKPAAFPLLAILALAACGGGNSERATRYYGGPAVSFASGPISSGCLTSGRQAANRQLCGCIQGVANQSLSGSDQRMAASFFADPHRAQEIRQSDNPRHEDFWKRYRAFADRAEQTCQGY
jgi:hypothetical protein